MKCPYCSKIIGGDPTSPHALLVHIGRVVMATESDIMKRQAYGHQAEEQQRKLKKWQAWQKWVEHKIGDE